MRYKVALAALFVGLSAVGCSDDAPSEGGVPTGEQAFAACDAAFEITAPNPQYVWTPNAIVLTSEELAPGVFAVYDKNAAEYGPKGIPLATSGGFVVGKDGVLLVESMINRQLFCQLIGIVREKTDKPITHVVNTSSHGDHSYGNAFLPEGVHIVQHERTAAYIAQHFAEDIAFMSANFGDDQGLDELHPVAADTLVTDDGWSVDLGNYTVEARYHGFAQTEGDLFVHVPGAKVLWTGNPLVTEKPGIPWLLDGHAEEVGVTLSEVKASLTDDTIVVPGHGRPVRPDGFDFSIDYLHTLVDEVSDAVDHGMSEEETASTVTMDSFKGYAIWDWVHTQVNVSKTYDELSR